MAERRLIESSLNELLGPALFKDYGPNGLQVEGRAEVRRLVAGVTASLAFIDAALAAGAARRAAGARPPAGLTTAAGTSAAADGAAATGGT